MLHVLWYLTCCLGNEGNCNKKFLCSVVSTAHILLLHIRLDSLLVFRDILINRTLFRYQHHDTTSDSTAGSSRIIVQGHQRPNASLYLFSPRSLGSTGKRKD